MLDLWSCNLQLIFLFSIGGVTWIKYKKPVQEWIDVKYKVIKNVLLDKPYWEYWKGNWKVNWWNYKSGSPDKELELLPSPFSHLSLVNLSWFSNFSLISILNLQCFPNLYSFFFFYHISFISLSKLAVRISIVASAQTWTKEIMSVYRVVDFYM